MSSIGLAWLTVPELAPPAQVSLAAQLGYTHVGLRLIPVAGQTLPAFDQRELEQRLADTGVSVLDVEVFRLEPDTDVRAFEPTMALSARMKATELLLHGADPVEARLAETLSRFCDLALQYRLNANLEPMPWVDIATVNQAKQVLERAGRKNSAVLVDPIHFFRADNRLEDIPREVRYAQFCDARPERPSDPQELIRQARGDRLFPGEGGLDLRGLLGALPPGLPISLEVPHAGPFDARERARRALAALRKLL